MVIDTLCLSSGGIFGISFLSAIKYLLSNKYFDLSNIQNYYGTSVGSIINFLLIIGYMPDEIINILLTYEISDLNIDINIDNLIYEYGLDDGNKIMNLIIDLCEKKLNVRDITFIELYNLTKKNYVINSTNFTTSSEFIMSWQNTPELSVIKGIKMSIAVPLLFSPILHNEHYFIDGAIINPFLINLCNAETTLGICCNRSKFNELKSLQDLIMGSLLILARPINETENILKIIFEKDIPQMIINKATIDKLLEIGYKYGKSFYLKKIKNEISNKKLIINNKINNIVNDIINKIIDNVSTSKDYNNKLIDSNNIKHSNNNFDVFDSIIIYF